MPTSKKYGNEKPGFFSVAQIEISGYPVIHGVLGFFYFVAFLR